MSSLRKEIEQEMSRVRIDKTRLFDLLLKIVDNSGSGSGDAGPTGADGVRGPAGPAGPVGPACECKCVSVGSSSSTKAPVKKIVSKKNPVSVDA